MASVDPEYDKPFLVIGAGGHAKVVIDVLHGLKCEIKGIVDPNSKKGFELLGVPVIGDDNLVYDHDPANIFLANGIGALPEEDLRWKLAKKLRVKGYYFPALIHKTAIIADSVELKEGVQIMAGAVLQPGVSINQDTIINTHASIDHDCNIGCRCHIAPGVTISGGVNVGNDVHVGTGASIIQSISIGNDCVIGAGALVMKNIPEKTKFISRRV